MMHPSLRPAPVFWALLLIPAVAAAAQVTRSGKGHCLDPVRQFELHAGPAWTFLDADLARAVDPEASAVARYDLETAYLAVEARRLPHLALSEWASAWDALPEENQLSSLRNLLGGRYPGTRSFISLKVEGNAYTVHSEFRRAHGWAYRISRYLPLGADRDLRDRLMEAAEQFQARPPRETGPMPGPPGGPASPPSARTGNRYLSDGAVVRDGVWGKPGVAATMRIPPGWELVRTADPTLFLPEDLEIKIRSAVDKYQAGLLVLGDVVDIDGLLDRLRSVLGRKLDRPSAFRYLGFPGEIRATCTSSLPEGRSPRGLPLSWLIQGRILEGQGIALLVGVTGLGLDEDRQRMARVFSGLGDPCPGFFPDRSVELRRGAILSSDAGFRCKLPVTWVPDLTPRDQDEAGREVLIHACRHDPLAPEDIRPSIRAVVERLGSRDREAVENLKAELNRTWTRISCLETGNPAPGRVMFRGVDLTPEGLVRMAATLIFPSGGRTALVLKTRVPDAAAMRLAPEVEAIHENFTPVHGVTGGPDTGSVLYDGGGVRISGGRYEDALRNVRIQAREGWIWFLGDHARFPDLGASVKIKREKSQVLVSLVSERIPGFSVRRWAAYQRLRKPRAGPDGRLFAETPGFQGRWKSIVESRDGWCIRATIYLPDAAQDSERAAGLAALRSYGSLDPETSLRFPTPPSRLLATAPHLSPDQAVKDGCWARRKCPVSLRIPPGWRLLFPATTGLDIPREVIATMEDTDLGHTAILVDMGTDPDLPAQGKRLEDAFRATMLSGEILRPSHHKGGEIYIEAACDVPGQVPATTVPSRWLMRIARFGDRTFGILAWCKGTTLVHDRQDLENALEAMGAVPDGFWDHR